jgi:hypothetical protein
MSESCGWIVDDAALIVVKRADQLEGQDTGRHGAARPS